MATAHFLDFPAGVFVVADGEGGMRALPLVNFREHGRRDAGHALGFLLFGEFFDQTCHLRVHFAIFTLHREVAQVFRRAKPAGEK